MDAENDNDQPNSSSASASITPSSSNNSSSSNLLGHLPMLPFMRSTDDDDHEDDDGVNDNDMMHEEPMPLQQPRNDGASMGSERAGQQAPNATTAEASTGAETTSNATAEPMRQQQFMEGTRQDEEQRQSLTNNIPPSSQPQLSSPLPLHLVPVPASQTLDTTLSPSPQALSFISPSSFSSSSSSSSSSSHQSYNLAHHQEQIPIPSSSVSSSIPTQQQQDHQALPPPPQALQPPSSIVASTSSSTPPRVEQDNRNDIADAVDDSAVIAQPLVSNAVHAAPGEEGAERNQAAENFDNDIQLDDNDNNDIDVDLNARNDSVAAATTSSASVTSNRRQSSPPQTSSSSSPPQEQQQPQRDSSPLDTSASGSAGTSGRSQPPTTLPLLLYQQPQQQTEESKHLPPSYDHHYHHHHRHHHHHHQQQQQNPRENHPHTQHPYQYPYDFASSLQQQKSANGATGASTNNSSNMFGNTSSDRNQATGASSSAGPEHGAGGGSGQVVDRLKLLYPNVNENETPLPRCWSPHDKCLSIGLSQNNLRVLFKGVGKQNNDAASVRTAHPIPPACGIYYFEVKIICKGKNGYTGIGLTAQHFRMNRLPGWDKQSYGYHGDDGNSFSSSGHGMSYGPTFTTGDIIGCCVNFVNNTCFYTKNGIDLGIAFTDLPTKLYPTIGMQTPGEEVDANFGQEPFKFEQIEEMMKQMRAEVKTTIYDFPLQAEQGDPTTLLQKMVNSYLVGNGYSETAEAFSHTTGQSLREDIASIRNRQKILKLVMSGRMGQAIEQTLRSFPGLLEHNKNLWFMLKCRQFIEMINGSDIENGNTTDASAVAVGEAVAAAAAADASSSSTPPTTLNAPTTANNNTSTSNNFSSNSNSSCSANNSSNTAATQTAAATTGTSCSNNTTCSNTNNGSSSSAANVGDTTTNNAQNSSHITVINTDNDIKNQSNLAEHCSAAGDAPTKISKNNNDNDYLNDVEMENNGHSTNGNVCKNGNTSSFNDSLEADEDMDVDMSPSVRKYSHGIERILEFGKDLSLMGQQLEKESKMTGEERQMLEDAFSLIAYSNPWASPLGWQLCPSKRETVCRALNSAILESMNYAKWPPLEYCVTHANELLKVMAQSSIGACAFVNITDVFPKN